MLKIHLRGALSFALLLATSALILHGEDAFRFPGTVCTPAPYLHCPDSECSSATVINQGPVVEMKTRRTYFLDYPCDMKKGDKVTFILSLHGAGSYGNWQRHYFPILDYKDKYRLVIATPNSPTRVWSNADDTYLQNIVDFVIESLGRENIQAFWLAGHSQGGMTSNRLVRTDYFKDKVDGWLSLSGGRLGGNPGRGSTFAPAGSVSTTVSATVTALREPPAVDISFLCTTGQREMDDKGLPATSTWAAKYNCGERKESGEVADGQAGYVFDSGRLNLLRPGWGLLPGPGKAAVYEYPNCSGGRVVADIVRLDKGHTEGLEPKVTERLIQLMLSAKGGKLQSNGAVRP